MIRFATYNTLDLFHDESDRDRWDAVAEVITGLSADVVALQEIRADRFHLGPAMQWLSEATGLDCWVRRPDYGDGGDRGEPAVEPGGHGFGVGLLWNADRVQLVRDSVRRVGGPDLWHGLIMAAFDVDTGHGPVRVAHGSYHAPPFGQHRRRDEAERIVGLATRHAPAGAP